MKKISQQIITQSQSVLLSQLLHLIWILNIQDLSWVVNSNLLNAKATKFTLLFAQHWFLTVVLLVWLCDYTPREHNNTANARLWCLSFSPAHERTPPQQFVSDTETASWRVSYWSLASELMPSGWRTNTVSVPGYYFVLPHLTSTCIRLANPSLPYIMTLVWPWPDSKSAIDTKASDSLTVFENKQLIVMTEEIFDKNRTTAKL